MVTCSLKYINVISMKDFEIIIEQIMSNCEQNYEQNTMKIIIIITILASHNVYPYGST